MLTVQTSTWSPSLEASSLNRRVSLSQTGVSRDGTALKIKTLPRASLSLTVCRELSTAEKSGAACPGLISGPDRVTGPPLKVTTPVLSSGICFLLRNWGHRVGTCNQLTSSFFQGANCNQAVWSREGAE